MPEIYIAGLRTKLENFKEQASEDAKMFCYLNDDKVNKLLEEALTIRVFFKALNVENETKQKLNALINEIQDFADFVNDTVSAHSNGVI